MMIARHVMSPGPLQPISTVPKVRTPGMPSGSPRLPVSVAAATSAGSGTSGSTATATDPSDITGTDFLTLLVSELKNQDPTQPTDPQAYVQQLVGVNSLQQLIDINQTLSGDASGTTKG